MFGPEPLWGGSEALTSLANDSFGIFSFSGSSLRPLGFLTFGFGPEPLWGGGESLYPLGHRLVLLGLFLIKVRQFALSLRRQVERLRDCGAAFRC